jgi:arylsulfatase A-like enzyme
MPLPRRYSWTELCSPTWAALLTGCNHHSAGTGVIIEMGTGYPGYTGIIPKSTATVVETLRDNGYGTAMFGKAHNTPEPEIRPAGPFHNWPTGQGFNYFYGFNQGKTHQYYPTLYRNTTPVPQPKTPEQGYHFSADLSLLRLDRLPSAHRKGDGVLMALTMREPSFRGVMRRSINTNHFTVPSSSALGRAS